MSEEAQPLETRPAYRAAMLIGEADAILACFPRSRALRNGACIVRGYVEAKPYYFAENFPWEYLAKKIVWMRRIADGHQQNANNGTRISPLSEKYFAAESLWRSGEASQREASRRAGVCPASFASWLRRRMVRSDAQKAA